MALRNRPFGSVSILVLSSVALGGSLLGCSVLGGFGDFVDEPVKGSDDELEPGDVVDLDGDGNPDGVAVDTDGDGVVDGIDTSGNGAVDVDVEDIPSGDGDTGGTSGDGDTGGTSGDGDTGGTSGDGDSDTGGTSGDGDMPMVQEPLYDGCTLLGGAFDILTDAEVIAVDAGYKIEGDQEIYAVPTGSGVVVGSVVGYPDPGGGPSSFFVRHVPESGVLGPVEERGLAASFNPAHGRVAMGNLEFFGSSDQFVSKVTFAVDGGDQITPGSGAEQGIFHACPGSRHQVQRAVFDYNDPEGDYAYVCSAGPVRCDNGGMCDGGDPCPGGVLEGECCDPDNCSETYELRVSSDHMRVIATDTEESDSSLEDPTLKLTSYVFDGTQHLITGEFSPLLRGGDDALLGTVQEVNLGTETTFVNYAIPSSDDTGALLFALHAYTDNLFTGPKSIFLGTVDGSDFGSLEDNASDFMVRSYDFEVADALPQRPVLFNDFVVLGTVDESARQKAGFTMYDREGELLVQAFEAFAAPDNTIQIERVQAAPLDGMVPRVLVVWTELDTTSGNTKIRGQRVSCL